MQLFVNPILHGSIFPILFCRNLTLYTIALWTQFCTVLLTLFFSCAALRTGQEAEKVQVFPRRDLDEHHLPGQLYAAGDALPVPEELCGLPGEATRLRDRRWPRLPVQLRLLSTNGNFFFYPTNILYMLFKVKCSKSSMQSSAANSVYIYLKTGLNLQTPK
jgi:hypothetical protein